MVFDAPQLIQFSEIFPLRKNCDYFFHLIVIVDLYLFLFLSKNSSNHNKLILWPQKLIF